MSYPPNDPYAPGPPDPSGQQHNPYAAPSGSNPYGSPDAGPSGQPSPYGPSPYGQPTPYDQPPMAPPVYGAPAGYNPYAPPPGNDGMAVAAMWCGIGIVLCGALTGIVALILGIIALGRISRTGAGGRGMAITGIVLGGLSIVVGIAWLALGGLSLWSADSSYYY